MTHPHIVIIANLLHHHSYLEHHHHLNGEHFHHPNVEHHHHLNREHYHKPNVEHNHHPNEEHFLIDHKIDAILKKLGLAKDEVRHQKEALQVAQNYFSMFEFDRIL